ncbi:hypothetical protein GBAR_LOCUS13151, partial [Geodia barretti]
MAEALLDSVVTDRDIAIIAQEYLTKWEEISPFLKLKNVTDENIRRTPGGYQEQKKALLREWKRLHSSNATFRVLIRAAEEANNMMLADELRCMLENNNIERVYRADSNGSSGRDKTDCVFTEGHTGSGGIIQADSAANEAVSYAGTVRLREQYSSLEESSLSQSGDRVGGIIESDESGYFNNVPGEHGVISVLTILHYPVWCFFLVICFSLIVACISYYFIGLIAGLYRSQFGLLIMNV